MVITAVVLEGRRPAEVAACYRVARSWVYELVARHREESEAAFEPRKDLAGPVWTPARTPSPGTSSITCDSRIRFSAVRSRVTLPTPVLVSCQDTMAYVRPSKGDTSYAPLGSQPPVRAAASMRRRDIQA